MKVIRIARIAKCPVCGGLPQMVVNAAKRFQVRCKSCEFRTGWMRKTDAVISWYNMSNQYRINLAKAEQERIAKEQKGNPE